MLGSVGRDEDDRSDGGVYLRKSGIRIKINVRFEVRFGDNGDVDFLLVEDIGLLQVRWSFMNFQNASGFRFNLD